MSISTLLLNFSLALHHCLSSYRRVVVIYIFLLFGGLTIWLIEIFNTLYVLLIYDGDTNPHIL